MELSSYEKKTDRVNYAFQRVVGAAMQAKSGVLAYG